MSIYELCVCIQVLIAEKEHANKNHEYRNGNEFSHFYLFMQMKRDRNIAKNLICTYLNVDGFNACLQMWNGLLWRLPFRVKKCFSAMKMI